MLAYSWEVKTFSPKNTPLYDLELLVNKSPFKIKKIYIYKILIAWMCKGLREAAVGFKRGNNIVLHDH